MEIEKSIEESIKELGKTGDPKGQIQAIRFKEMLNTCNSSSLVSSKDYIVNQIQKEDIEAQEIFKGLKDIIRDYDPKSPTPEWETEFWQAFITFSIRQAGPDVVQCLNPDKIVVPKCKRTIDELQELEATERGMVYIPDGFSYPLLGKIFTKMLTENVAEDALNPNGEELTYELQRKIQTKELRSQMLERLRGDTWGKLNLVKDVLEGLTGWVDFDMCIDTPNRYTTEENLKNNLWSEKRAGGTLMAYRMASEKMHVLEGAYLDESGTSSRLLGSHIRGNAIIAVGNWRGGLKIFWLSGSRYRDRNLGGRGMGY